MISRTHPDHFFSFTIGLTWSLAAEQLHELASCRVAALDLRGHGETEAGAEGDLSKDSLARDVRAVGDQLLLQGGHKASQANWIVLLKQLIIDTVPIPLATQNKLKTVQAFMGG